MKMRIRPQISKGCFFFAFLLLETEIRAQNTTSNPSNEGTGSSQPFSDTPTKVNSASPVPTIIFQATEPPLVQQDTTDPTRKTIEEYTPTTDPSTKPTFETTSDSSPTPLIEPTPAPLLSIESSPPTEARVSTSSPTLAQEAFPTTQPRTNFPTRQQTLPDPTFKPTFEQTPEPSSVLKTPGPTLHPTPEPTAEPTSVQRTPGPTPDVTPEPTAEPTSVRRTPGPTLYVTTKPSPDPTQEPTQVPVTPDPTPEITPKPSINRTDQPTIEPSNAPMIRPSDGQPFSTPSLPTGFPTLPPTEQSAPSSNTQPTTPESTLPILSSHPSYALQPFSAPSRPTSFPIDASTLGPFQTSSVPEPSAGMSNKPSPATQSIPPFPLPTTMPAPSPVVAPTNNPLLSPEFPSPTTIPQSVPTNILPPLSTPTVVSTARPSAQLSTPPSPTTFISVGPTYAPQIFPITPYPLPSSNSKGPMTISTTFPSLTLPTSNPSDVPSLGPTYNPTPPPTRLPTTSPTVIPGHPSRLPTTQEPSASPSTAPSVPPSAWPSGNPSSLPSRDPSPGPSSEPSSTPTITAIPTITGQPSGYPTISTQPSMMPSSLPSTSPSITPTEQPSASPSDFRFPLVHLSQGNNIMNLSPIDPVKPASEESWEKVTKSHIEKEILNVLATEIVDELVVAVAWKSQEPPFVSAAPSASPTEYPSSLSPNMFAESSLGPSRLRQLTTRDDDEISNYKAETGAVRGTKGAMLLDMRRVKESNLNIVFSVEIYIRSSREEHVMNEYIGGAFDSAADREAYRIALVLSDAAFESVQRINVILPDPPPLPEPEPSSSNGASPGLIIGLVVVGLGGVAIGIFALRRRRRRQTQNQVKNGPTFIIGAADDESNDMIVAINVDEGDVSTLGDPIPIHLRQSEHASVADTSSIDFDFQKAYRRSDEVIATETSPGEVTTSPNQCISTDETLAEQNVSARAFKIEAPPGPLGLVLEPDNDGTPTVYAINPDSLLASVVRVGDILLSVDGEDVSTMLTSEVSRLITGDGDSDVRAFVFRRPAETSQDSCEPSRTEE